MLSTATAIPTISETRALVNAAPLLRHAQKGIGQADALLDGGPQRLPLLDGLRGPVGGLVLQRRSDVSQRLGITFLRRDTHVIQQQRSIAGGDGKQVSQNAAHFVRVAALLLQRLRQHEPGF